MEMKSMKKILSLLLAVVLVVGCMTVAVWAEGEAADHQHIYDKLIKSVPATCQSLSYVIYGCSHEGCTETREQWGEGLAEHKYVKNEKESVAPTCETKGKEISYCSVCKDKQVKELSALGHSFPTKPEDGKVTKEPTCTEEGKRVFYCKNAGCDKTKDEILPKVPHTFVIKETKDPTCTEEGFKISECSCGTKKTVTLEKVPHVFSVEKEKIEPTCEDEGYTVFKCKNCDATENQKMTPATGHCYVDDNNGNTHTCTNMNCPQKTTEHRFTEWKTVTKNGFFTNAIESHKCVDCGYEASRQIPKTNTLYKLAHGTFGFGLFLILSPITGLLKLLKIEL